MNRKILVISSALIFSLFSISSDAQMMNNPCSPRMLSSISGCMSSVTGNGNSPTSGCCEALKSLTGSGMDCLCLIVTESVPFSLPINRTLAISLPRACGMPGVLVQCKASTAPLPAPGPMSFTLTPSPTDSQTSEEPASFRPTTPPKTSLNPKVDQDSELDKGGEPPSSRQNSSASLPSSSNYLKLSLILFTFVMGSSNSSNLRADSGYCYKLFFTFIFTRLWLNNV